MYAEERQQAMAELVARRGRVSVNDLAHEFAVTTETVRRDLSLLESRRLLRRVHGGALPIDSFTVLEQLLSDRDAANTEEKRRIAVAAAALLPDAEATLVIDAGSTTALLPEALPRDRALTVFTHSVPVAARLAELPHVELHLLPGRVRRNTQAAVGVETVQALSRIRADLAFVGTNGITLAHGLSTPDQTEAATKSAIVGCAQRVVVMADSSKIGQERTIRFAALEDVDVLVTDDGLEPDRRTELESVGLEVVVA
ncbi:DeoR/GlpR family DNA-binding transcription regulator [Nocardioides sp.]|uniref:DeoR/GlpR family DNA-binding transcription regulator n=1 Tax=Nocardioides sp. TaxID=35761 RepID=UPI0035295B4C